MDSLEVTARTVDEAINQALKQLGVSKDEVEIVVLSEGKKGILGLGAEPARVRVTPRAAQPPANVAEAARETLDALLKGMSVNVALTPRPSAEPVSPELTAVSFDISGEDAGLLIGRRGETLSSLQFLVNFMLSRKLRTRVIVNLDVEGYRERRMDVLKGLAGRMAERVKASGRPITLEPMPARERRIVHMTLAEHPDVTTQSVGDGEGRKVVIVPRRGAESVQRPPVIQARPPMARPRSP
ncbi:MAG: RNA-binding cell elongation regulator Jag/EloR [Chloroflexota bacterium]